MLLIGKQMPKCLARLDSAKLEMSALMDMLKEFGDFHACEDGDLGGA